MLLTNCLHLHASKRDNSDLWEFSRWNRNTDEMGRYSSSNQLWLDGQSRSSIKFKRSLLKHCLNFNLQYSETCQHEKADSKLLFVPLKKNLLIPTFGSNERRLLLLILFSRTVGLYEFEKINQYV